MVNCELCRIRLPLKSSKQLIKNDITYSISCCDKCIEKYNIGKE